VRTVVRRIGVDAQAAAKGHRSLTLVGDLDHGTVAPIAEDRKPERLGSDYAGLTQAQRDGSEAVAMDMWEPAIQATRAQVPNTDDKSVFDRFHVRGHISTAVDTVRKQEQRALMASGDETLQGRPYVWRSSQETVPEGRREAFAALRRQELTVGWAWALKETGRRLWHSVYIPPQAGSSGSGGISGPRTVDWSRCARPPRRFVGPSPTSGPTTSLR
jgi:transposase